jgi:hypothetical protein
MRRAVCSPAALGAALLCLALAQPAMAGAPARIHGLWVWKGPEIIDAPQGAERLRDFCRAQDVNEVYISVLSHGALDDAAAIAGLIALLHDAQVRVEALLSSTDADEAGRHRDTLLAHVRLVLDFDRQHPGSRFDGIHLDIEPQQRPENKGAGNLRFLPGLAAAFSAVRALAEPAGLTVNADIQNKLLKGSLEERRTLLESAPRLTLMLYELSAAHGGGNDAQAEQLRSASRAYLDMAYAGLGQPGLATLVIGLRTPDYGERLPQMLALLDDSNGANPHYQGWARHSYNDVLKGAP